MSNDPVKNGNALPSDAAAEAPIAQRIGMLERRVARLEDAVLPDDLTDPEAQHRLILAERSQRQGSRRGGRG